MCLVVPNIFKVDYTNGNFTLASKTRMSANQEFDTVDLIVNSTSETRGVDAFALSVIKAERQLRKLFTHLVFQFPCFGSSDIGALHDALANNKRIYFSEIENCINALCSSTVEKMVGADYSRLRKRVEEAIECRNKIFHGQLTQRFLAREDLLGFVQDIRGWCDALTEGAVSHIGYDGFARNSFRKSASRDLSANFKVQFSRVDDYAQFLKQHMRARNS